MKCTWKNCDKDGIIDQIDRNGNTWAKLCIDHHKILEKSIGDEPKILLKNWVLAMGGAEKSNKKNDGIVT